MPILPASPNAVSVDQIRTAVNTIESAGGGVTKTELYSGNFTVPSLSPSGGLYVDMDVTSTVNLGIEGASTYWTIEWSYSDSYYYARTAIASYLGGVYQTRDQWLTLNAGGYTYPHTTFGVYGSYSEYTNIYYYNLYPTAQHFLRIYFATNTGKSGYNPNGGGTGTLKLIRVTGI